MRKIEEIAVARIEAKQPNKSYSDGINENEVMISKCVIYRQHAISINI